MSPGLDCAARLNATCKVKRARMRNPAGLGGALALIVLIVLAAGTPAWAHPGSPPRRRLLQFPDPQRRSGRLRRALRARRALPRLEFLLSAHRLCARHLLAEEQAAAAGGGQMLRIGCARRGRDRAAARRARIFHRSLRRRLSQYRHSDRSRRRRLHERLPRRQSLPRLDLCAARLYRRLRALLSEVEDHAAAPQAVLYFRSSPVVSPRAAAVRVRPRRLGGF